MGQESTIDRLAWASPWRQRSVRDKGLLAAGLLLLALVLPPLPGALEVSAVALIVMLGPIGVSVKRLGRIVAVPAVAILLGALPLAVHVESSSGGVVVSLDGWPQAVSVTLRAVAATLAMLTLATATPVSDLLHALRRIGVPGPLVEVAAVVYRFSFGLIESMAAVQQAQAARLGYVSWRSSMRSSSMAVSGLFLRAWDRAIRLEEGLALRGYREGLPVLQPARHRSSMFVLSTVAVLALMVVGAMVAEVGW